MPPLRKDTRAEVAAYTAALNRWIRERRAAVECKGDESSSIKFIKIENGERARRKTGKVRQAQGFPHAADAGGGGASEQPGRDLTA